MDDTLTVTETERSRALKSGCFSKKSPPDWRHLSSKAATAVAQNGEVAPGAITGPAGSVESAPVGTSAHQIDMSAVNWLHTNVSGWAQTSTITEVSIGSPPIRIEHTKAGQWPAITAGGTVVEGNPWIFANIDGEWHAATYE